MNTYKVGDEVEIAGYKQSHDLVDVMPDMIHFYDVCDTIDQLNIIWTKVNIEQVYESGGLLIYWKHRHSTWYVDTRDVHHYIRPLNTSIQMQVTTTLATNCINCHEGFMYPVEHNVKGGRLCFSCKSVYSWKYAS